MILGFWQRKISRFLTYSIFYRANLYTTICIIQHYEGLRKMICNDTDLVLSAAMNVRAQKGCSVDEWTENNQPTKNQSKSRMPEPPRLFKSELCSWTADALEELWVFKMSVLKKQPLIEAETHTQVLTSVSEQVPWKFLDASQIPLPPSDWFHNTA